MSEQQAVESILAADIGSTLTHVCLLDRVEGQYRFLAHAEAPTTLSDPDSDLTVGLRRAVRRLEQITQRPLLSADEELLTPEQSSGVGVDAFVATANAAPPLQGVIVGLTDALSVESAQHACAAANVVVTQTIPLGARMRQWDDQTLAALRQTPPDVIVIVGGIDTGPVAPLESAARVLAAIYADMSTERRPRIIFAGNQEARRPLATILSKLFDYRVVDNVRPNMRTESLTELQRELADIYEHSKLAGLPGYRRLRQWCATPVLSTFEAFGMVLRYVARQNALPQGVLGMDIGGATTYVGVARGDSYQWAIGADLGTSFGIAHTADLSGIGHLQRWMPIAMSTAEISARLENAHLRPHSIPQTMEEVLLTHALVRQALLLTLRPMRRQFWRLPESKPEEETMPPFDLILARGGALAHTAQDGIILLSLLDALQPTGLTRVAVDWASLWPQLGAVARIAPLAAAQVLERDGFRELGTVIAPSGEARDGEPALRLKIMRADGQVTEADLPAGTLQCFPLAAHEQATIEVRPSRNFDIGLHRKGYGGRAQVRGGSLGIVVDTRGRPLSLPQDAPYRQGKLQEWLENLANDGHRSS